MENDELEKRLAFLKKELALKKQKLEKCERKKRAKEHVRQRIREHLASGGKDLPVCAESCSELSVLNQVNPNVEKSRKCCVSFKLSPLGPLSSCDCSSNNNNNSTSANISSCKDEELTTLNLASDSTGTNQESLVVFDQKRVESLSESCFGIGQHEASSKEQSNEMSFSCKRENHDYKRSPLPIDMANAGESSQVTERSAHNSETDLQNPSVLTVETDEEVNALRNALGAFKIVIKASVESSPTDFELPKIVFADLMKERVDFVRISNPSQCSSVVNKSWVTENARPSEKFGRSTNIVDVACRQSTSESCLPQKTGRGRRHPRKLSQDIRQNDRGKAVTEHASDFLRPSKLENLVLESGDKLTVSAVNFAEQEDAACTLNMDCETVTVAGQYTCIVLTFYTSGFTISVVDGSSLKVLHVWSAAQNEVLMLAKLMPDTINSLSVLVALRCPSGLLQYCLVTFNVEESSTCPVVLQLKNVINRQTPIICTTASREFVVETSEDDSGWCAERFTVQHDCSCVVDTIQLQKPVRRPSFLVKIDDHGCVGGISGNELTIWHLQTGLILQRITTQVHVTCCSRIFAEEGLLYMPCFVEETDIFGGLLVINPLTAKSCIVNRLQKPKTCCRFNKLAVSNQFICAVSEAGVLCVWSLRWSDLVFCDTEQQMGLGSAVRCVAVDRQRDNHFLIRFDKTLQTLSLISRPAT